MYQSSVYPEYYNLELGYLLTVEHVIKISALGQAKRKTLTDILNENSIPAAIPELLQPIGSTGIVHE